MLVEISFRRRSRMGVDIRVETYGARTGGSMLHNEMENGVLKEKRESFSAKV
jgi:hypothetical protein